MELKLNKPICFFDLETTGIDVGKDRIVEISIFKVFPNGNKETWLVNPTIPIPAQTTVHGITDEKVAMNLNELAFRCTKNDKAHHKSLVTKNWLNTQI
jgi:DNA polymerase-3 subunit epsilon